MPRSTVRPVGSRLDRRLGVVVIALLVYVSLLGLAFAQPAGSSAFYLFTLGLAAVGIVGGLLSGPIPMGAAPLRRAWSVRALGAPLLLGVVAAGVFLLGAEVVRQIRPLRDLVSDVVTHAHGTSFALILLVTILNAAAEEIFFRGAVYAALGRWRGALTTTAVYVAAIAVSADLALIFAAAVLGLVLGIERRISGGVLAPICTHVVWSVILLVALPPLFPH